MVISVPPTLGSPLRIEEERHSNKRTQRQGKKGYPTTFVKLLTGHFSTPCSGQPQWIQWIEKRVWREGVMKREKQREPVSVSRTQPHVSSLSWCCRACNRGCSSGVCLDPHTHTFSSPLEGTLCFALPLGPLLLGLPLSASALSPCQLWRWPGRGVGRVLQTTNVCGSHQWLHLYGGSWFGGLHFSRPRVTNPR